MKVCKLGIVGLGRVSSNTHIPVLRTLKNVKIIAGAEKNPQRAKRVKEIFAIKNVYSDYEEMFDSEKLDGIYVCLPNYLHYDACVKAMHRGINVLCEKPMGISLKESSDMSILARRNNLILMPGYKKRYAKNFSRAKKMICQGLLGKIIQVNATFMTPGPYISWDPKSEWYLDEKWHGVIYDIGCHIIDLLHFILSRRIKNIFAVKQNGFLEYNTPTNIAAAFQMESDIIGSLIFGWRASTDIIEIMIHGTAGSLRVSRDILEYQNPGTDPIDKIKSNVNNAKIQFTELLKKVIRKMNNKDYYYEDLEQARLFVGSVLNGAEPEINGKDAVYVHLVLQLIVESLEKTKREDIVKLRA